MVTIYIKELTKDEIQSINNIKWKIIKKLNIIQTKQIGKSQKIYLIPNLNKTSVYKKVIKKIEKEKTKTEKVQIVLSNSIKKYQQYFKKCKIIDGKSIFFNSVEKILEKVLQGNLLLLQDLYILANNFQEKNINLIRNLAPKVRTVNIVTKEIEKYKIIEEMLQESGVPIVITNNKKKSLKKSKIIINLDFSQEELSEYIIFRNAVIINLTQEKLTKLKGFCGITIRDIDLNLNNEQIEFIKQNYLENFRQIEIYESLPALIRTIDNPEVSKLYGNNGEISNKELENIKANFCEFSVKN